MPIIAGAAIAEEGQSGGPCGPTAGYGGTPIRALGKG